MEEEPFPRPFSWPLFALLLAATALLDVALQRAFAGQPISPRIAVLVYAVVWGQVLLAGLWCSVSLCPVWLRGVVLVLVVLSMTALLATDSGPGTLQRALVGCGLHAIAALLTGRILARTGLIWHDAAPVPAETPRTTPARWQFSLARMFLLVTAFCVALGMGPKLAGIGPGIADWLPLAVLGSLVLASSAIAVSWGGARWPSRAALCLLVPAACTIAAAVALDGPVTLLGAHFGLLSLFVTAWLLALRSCGAGLELKVPAAGAAQDPFAWPAAAAVSSH